MCQTKPLSRFVSSFPVFLFPKLSKRCVVLCLDQLAVREARVCVCVLGEGGGWVAKACTTNSAHERLMQQEQLSSIVGLQISSVPHFASQCVSSKREPRRGEHRGNKPK